MVHQIIFFRYNYPKFPSVRTIIAQPANCNDEYEEGQVKLAKVKKVMMDKDAMEKIKEEYHLSEDASKDEYTKMREERVRAMLDVANVDFDEYHKLLAMNRKGVQVILQRDIEEVNINSYNPKWLELWNANLDIQPVADFFAVITYITEYAFKPEPQELEMIKALDAVKGEGMEKMMKVIHQSFQDHREMGEAEALYKIIPGMLLTNSNVGKQWVCLSRDKDRTTRARKAFPQDVEAGRDVFQLEGVTGSWIEQWDMRTKYCRRPAEYAHACFAQWARMMEAHSLTKKKDEESGEVGEAEENVDMSVEEGSEAVEEPWFAPFHKVMVCSHQCCTDKPKEDCEKACCQAKNRRRMSWRRKLEKTPKTQKEEDLPALSEVSNPHTGEPRLMKKRKIPKVLQFYKHKKDINPIKFFLEELILCVPFGLEENGDTMNLLEEPDEQIVRLYDKYAEHIREVKSQILPFLEDVSEERFFVEEMKKHLDVEEMGLQVAPCKEIDNQEAMDAEVIFTSTYKVYHSFITGRRQSRLCSCRPCTVGGRR